MLEDISICDAQGNYGIKSYIPDETIWDPKFSRINQANEEMNQPREQDMEIGYEESPPPPTYEGLEQRFIDEIMKLTREKSDAEDSEFARHEERILEINAEYQMKDFPEMKVPDAYGYACPPTFTDEESIGSRFHGAIEFKHSSSRTNHGREANVPLPPGRVYNNSAAYH